MGTGMRVRKLRELTWIEIREVLNNGIERAIIPIGTIEAHGTHLPLGTDLMTAESIAEKLNAMLLPTIF